MRNSRRESIEHVDRVIGALWLVVLFGMAIVGLCICIATHGFAEWAKVAGEWPDLTQGQKDWFIQQHNEKGMLCCSEADGHPTDWDIKDNHYWAVVENEWREIPDDAVVNVPNPVKRAVVWWSSTVTDGNGKKLIRCFIPGPGA